MCNFCDSVLLDIHFCDAMKFLCIVTAKYINWDEVVSFITNSLPVQLPALPGLSSDHYTYFSRSIFGEVKSCEDEDMDYERYVF